MGRAKVSWPYPNNWTEDYEYYCDNAWKRELGKSMVTSVGTIISVLMLSLADIIGRKRVLMLTGLLMIVGISITLFADNLFIKLTGLSILACSDNTFSGLFTIYIDEVTGKKKG